MPSEAPGWVPSFVQHLAVAVVDDDTVILLSEESRRVLRGGALGALLRLIDGTKTVEQLSMALDPRAASSEVLFLLDHLALSGYLTLADSECGPRCVPAPLADAGSEGLRVGSMHVFVRCQHLDVSTLVRALSRVTASQTAQIELTVVVCDDYLDLAVAELVTRRSGPVIVAKLCGARPTIGPLLSAAEGPCWRCVTDALEWNRPVQRFARQRLALALATPVEHGSAGFVAALEVLTSELAAVLTQDHSLRDRLLCVERSTGVLSSHRLRQRPQCPRCGASDWMTRQSERAPRLRSVRIDAEEGGHRICTSQETFDRYQHLISPLTGVVNYLHPMPGRHGAERYVYVSGYQVCPQRLGPDNAFDKICAGKGRTDVQARTSALCEALERVSSVWQGDEPVTVASRNRLNERAISFCQLQNFSERQYQERERINASSGDRRRQVPLRCTDDTVLGWTAAWPLDGGERHLVPLAYCFAETPQAMGSDFGIYNPNGTAAGNCLEEAILHALLELVERDAAAIWWYNRVSRPELDCERLEDAFVSRLFWQYAELGWRVRVLDITHDLGIPVYVAVAFHERAKRHALGFGCHLQPRVALSRALTELNQLLDSREEAPSPWDRALLPRADFLDSTGDKVELGPPLGSADLKTDIATCAHRLADANLRAFCVNKTRPDLGLAVVQIIVPGLRHFWPRFGAGRLYDVPVALGWLTTPTLESSLNPAPLFL